ncbi:uncharacterized protein EAF02_002175 [Botrytis sinoallii]|uniref:uncharacterized protein n=1 Tax=Botrytis sinoallii TaxID=1463999 RepID=UPI001900EEBE|nr:uncharacterized protein EAF02_002175 [Botrytis sinoallii]KAF7889760.1 hypothetical protein EAF02_002175 [Botrytis sinoallii]
MLRRKMAARGYENRLEEARRNLPEVPDQSIPIIPILTPADSEWTYISPSCHYAGTGPVAEPVPNNVSPPSNTSVGNSDISTNARLKDARLKLKHDILRQIGQSLKDSDQTQVIKLRLRFDQLQVGMAETDSRIERMINQNLRAEQAKLEEELRKARADLAVIDANLASDEMVDDELGEEEMDEDEMDENRTNENDVSGENGREEIERDENERDENETDENERDENEKEENEKEENEEEEDEPEEELDDHKIDECKKEESEILEEMEEKKMDDYEMEDHKTNQHEMDKDQKREKYYDEKEILDSSFRQAIRKELDEELEKAFRKNKNLDLQKKTDRHSSKKRKFEHQEEQSDKPNPSPSSPDVESGGPEIAWIDTVPLLRELNTHLAGYKMGSSAEEIMDIRSWIDKGFDTGMRRILRNQPIADILGSWDNRYEEEGLNNILRSVVLVYDSIEDLHTLRAHYDRILGEAVLSSHSRAKVRDSGRND